MSEFFKVLSSSPTGSNGQVLKYNSSTGVWDPSADADTASILSGTYVNNGANYQISSNELVIFDHSVPTTASMPISPSYGDRVVVAIGASDGGAPVVLNAGSNIFLTTAGQFDIVSGKNMRREFRFESAVGADVWMAIDDHQTEVKSSDWNTGAGDVYVPYGPVVTGRPIEVKFEISAVSASNYAEWKGHATFVSNSSGMTRKLQLFDTVYKDTALSGFDINIQSAPPIGHSNWGISGSVISVTLTGSGTGLTWDVKTVVVDKNLPFGG